MWLWHDIGRHQKSIKIFCTRSHRSCYFHHVRLESTSQCHIFSHERAHRGDVGSALGKVRSSLKDFACCCFFWEWKRVCGETNCKLALETICAKKIFKKLKTFSLSLFRAAVIAWSCHSRVLDKTQTS